MKERDIKPGTYVTKINGRLVRVKVLHRYERDRRERGPVLFSCQRETPGNLGSTLVRRSARELRRALCRCPLETPGRAFLPSEVCTTCQGIGSARGGL